MKKFVFLVLFISTAFSLLFSQDLKDRFYELIKEGDFAYDKNNFTLYIQKYKEAFALDSGLIDSQLWYDLACGYGRLGNAELTSLYLEKSVKEGYNDYKYMDSDRDLDIIKSKARYESLYLSLVEREALLDSAFHYYSKYNYKSSKLFFDSANSISKLGFGVGNEYLANNINYFIELNDTISAILNIEELFNRNPKHKFSQLARLDFYSGAKDWLLQSFLVSQREDMALSQLLRMINNAKDKEALVFENKNFIYDLDQPNRTTSPILLLGSGETRPNLVFSNCSFDFYIPTPFSGELEGLEFNFCDIKHLRIYDDGLTTRLPIFKYCNIGLLLVALNFQPKDVVGLFQESSPNNLHIKSCTVENLRIILSDISPPIDLGITFSSISNLSIKAPNINHLEIYQTIVDEAIITVPLIKRFTSENSDYKTLQFNETIIEEEIALPNTSIQEHFIFNNSRLPELPISRINWNKSLGRYKIGITNGNRTITGRLEELGDANNFQSLMSLYSQFTNLYKSQNDIESYNPAYIMMKDIQSDRLKYLNKMSGTFESYFRYQLSRLLKFYVRHGTDPARALVVSTYIILVFAIFYFFYPSEWDKKSKIGLIQDFKNFIEKNDHGYIKPFISMLGGFFLSLANALTLSLNSFVTLGFGVIPTTGLARYVCVIQGFIGWFLLSIFTVALINQVLT